MVVKSCPLMNIGTVDFGHHQLSRAIAFDDLRTLKDGCAGFILSLQKPS